MRLRFECHNFRSPFRQPVEIVAFVGSYVASSGARADELPGRSQLASLIAPARFMAAPSVTKIRNHRSNTGRVLRVGRFIASQRLSFFESTCSTSQRIPGVACVLETGLS